MKEKTNNSLTQKNFTRFSEQINEIKDPVSGALGGILAYDRVSDTENIISSRFFNNKNKEISQIDIDNANIFLGSYIKRFKRLLDELKIEDSLNEPQKIVLENIIKGNMLKLVMFQSAIYIEAEKGGFPLQGRDRKKYLEKIEKIETLIYGPKVGTQKEEVEKIQTYLRDLLEEHHNLISEEELKKFKNLLPEDGYITEKDNKTEQIEGKLLKREEFCKIFQKVFEIYGIKSKIIILDKTVTEAKEQNGILYINGDLKLAERKEIYKEFGYEKCTKIVVDPSISAISTAESTIKIPAIYDTLSTNRVCELIEHEINTHLLTAKNNKKTINVKSDKYIETQEGIAVMSEKLVTKSVEELKIDEPTIHHISTFIGENYTLKETKDLLKIYFKLNGKSETDAEKIAEETALRVKRFHSFNEPGANRKDVVYRRGLIDAINYIQSLDKTKQEDIETLEKDIYKFYLSKLGKEELIHADQLVEGFKFKDKDLIMPIAIGKIIYEKLLGNNVNNIDEIRFKASDSKMNYKQKKILLQIIEMMK